VRDSVVDDLRVERDEAKPFRTGRSAYHRADSRCRASIRLVDEQITCQLAPPPPGGDELLDADRPVADRSSVVAHRALRVEVLRDLVPSGGCGRARR
jgi:hypothetical protein